MRVPIPGRKQREQAFVQLTAQRIFKRDHFAGGVRRLCGPAALKEDSLVSCHTLDQIYPRVFEGL